jgi:hypothetical protein
MLLHALAIVCVSDNNGRLRHPLKGLNTGLQDRVAGQNMRGFSLGLTAFPCLLPYSYEE